MFDEQKMTINGVLMSEEMILKTNVNYLDFIPPFSIHDIPFSYRDIPINILFEITRSLNLPIPNILSLKQQIISLFNNMEFSTTILPSIQINPNDADIAERIASSLEQAISQKNYKMIKTTISTIIQKCANNRQEQYTYGSPTFSRVLISLLSFRDRDISHIPDVLLCLKLLVQCNSSRLSVNLKMLNLLTASKVYEIIFQLLQENLQNEDICERSCFLLAVLAFDKKHRLLLIQNNISEKIIQLLQTHSNSVRIFQAVYHLVHLLVIEEKALMSFIKCNLFESIHAILPRCQLENSELLVSSFCDLVGFFASSDPGYDYLVANNISQLVFQIPSYWSESVVVISSFLKCVSRLILFRSETQLFNSQVWMQLAMCIEKALNVTQHTEECSLSGMVVLSGIFHYSNLSNYILDECICTETICSLVLNSLSDNTPERCIYTTTCLNICGLVKTNHSIGQFFYQKGICERLVSLIDSNLSSDLLQPTLVTLHYLSTSCSLCQVKIVELGIFNQLISLMQMPCQIAPNPVLVLVLGLLYDARANKFHDDIINELSSTNFFRNLMVLAAMPGDVNNEITIYILLGIYLSRIHTVDSFSSEVRGCVVLMLEKQSFGQNDMFNAILLAILGLTLNSSLSILIFRPQDCLIGKILDLIKVSLQSSSTFVLISKIILNLLSADLISTSSLPSSEYFKSILDMLQQNLNDLFMCQTFICLLYCTCDVSADYATPEHPRLLSLLLELLTHPILGEMSLQLVCRILFQILPTIKCISIGDKNPMLFLQCLNSISRKEMNNIDIYLIDMLYHLQMEYVDEHGDLLANILTVGLLFGNTNSISCVYRILLRMPDGFWPHINLKEFLGVLQSGIDGAKYEDFPLLHISLLSILDLSFSKSCSFIANSIEMQLHKKLIENFEQWVTNTSISALLLRIFTRLSSQFDGSLILERNMIRTIHFLFQKYKDSPNQILEFCRLFENISATVDSTHLLEDKVHLTMLRSLLAENYDNPLLPCLLRTLVNLAMKEQFKSTISLGDFDILFEKFFSYPDAQLLSLGCEVFSSFLLTESGKIDKVIQAHFTTIRVFQYLKSAILSKSSKNLDAVLLSILKLLISDSPPAVTLWISLDESVELIFSLITRYIETDTIIRVLVEILIEFSTIQTHHEILLSAGLCRYLVFILQRHSSDTTITTMTCRCCLHLVQSHPASIKVFLELGLLNDLIPLWKSATCLKHSPEVISQIIAVLSMSSDSADGCQAITLVQRTLIATINAQDDDQLIVSLILISELIELNSQSQLLLSSVGICELFHDVLARSRPFLPHTLLYLIRAIKLMCQSSSSSRNTVVVEKLIQLGVPGKIHRFLEAYPEEPSIIEDLMVLLFYFVDFTPTCLELKKLFPKVFSHFRTFATNSIIVGYSCRILGIFWKHVDRSNLVTAEEILQQIFSVLDGCPLDTDAIYQLLMLSSILLQFNDHSIIHYFSSSELPFKILLSLLKQFSLSPSVVCILCEILNRLWKCSPELSSSRFHQLEGCMIVSGITHDYSISNNDDCKTVLVLLCEVIVSYSTATVNQHDFSQAGISRDLINALQVYQADCKFVAVACSSLALIASYQDTDLSGSISVILPTLLHFHESVPDTVISICALCRNLSSYSQNCEMMLKHNLLESLLSSFFPFALSHAELTHISCEILKNLLINCHCGSLLLPQLNQLTIILSQSLQSYFNSGDIISSIYELVSTLLVEGVQMQDSFLTDLSRSVHLILCNSFHTNKIFVVICKLVQAITKTYHASIFHSHETISQFIVVLKCYEHDILLVGKPWLDAVTEIMNVAPQLLDTHQRSLIEIIIFSLLQKHADQPDTLSSALNAAKSLLTINESTGQTFGELGLCEILYSYLQTYQNSPAILCPILRLMTVLSSIDGNQNRLYRTGICESLPHLLHQYSNIFEVQYSLLEVLNGLSNHNDMVGEHLFKLGVCDILIEIMKTSKADILVSFASLVISTIVENKQMCGVWIILGGYYQYHLQQLHRLRDIDVLPFQFSYSILRATNVLIQLNKELHSSFSTTELTTLYFTLLKRCCEDESTVPYNLSELSLLQSILLQLISSICVELQSSGQLGNISFCKSVVMGMKRFPENAKYSMSIINYILEVDFSLLPSELSTVLVKEATMNGDESLVLQILASLLILLSKNGDDYFHEFVTSNGIDLLLTLMIQAPQFTLQIFSIFSLSSFSPYSQLQIDSFERYVSTLVYVIQSTDNFNVVRMSLKLLVDIVDSAHSLLIAQGIVQLCLRTIVSGFYDKEIVFLAWKLILDLVMIRIDILDAIVHSQEYLPLIVQSLSTYGEESSNIVCLCLDLAYQINHYGPQYLSSLFEFGLHLWIISLCKVFIEEAVVVSKVLSLVYMSSSQSSLEISHWSCTEIILVVLDILSIHRSDQQIILMGLKCVVFLASQPSNHIMLFVDPVIFLFMELLDLYLENGEVLTVVLSFLHLTYCHYNIKTSIQVTERILYIMNRILSERHENSDIEIVVQLIAHFCTIPDNSEIIKIIAPQSLFIRLSTFKTLSDNSLYYFCIILENLSLHDDWIPIIDDQIMNEMLQLLEYNLENPRLVQYILPVCAKFCSLQHTIQYFERTWKASIMCLENYSENHHLLNISLSSLVTLYNGENNILVVAEQTPVTIFVSLFAHHSYIYITNLLLLVSMLCSIPKLRSLFQQSSFCELIAKSLVDSERHYLEICLTCLLSILSIENNSRDLQISLLSSESLQHLVDFSFHHLSTDADTRIIMPVCRILSGIVNKDFVSSQELCRRGICARLILLLKYSSELDSPFSLELCSFIEVLCRDQSSLVMMISEGLLDVVIDILEDNRSAIDGCVVLLSDIVGNFMKQTDQDRLVFQDAIGRSGIFPSLVQSCSKYSDNIPILFHLFYILGSLCDRHYANSCLLMEIGAMPNNLIQLLCSSPSTTSIITVCQFMNVILSLSSSYPPLFSEVILKINDCISVSEFLESSHDLETVLQTLHLFTEGCGVDNIVIFRSATNLFTLVLDVVNCFSRMNDSVILLSLIVLKHNLRIINYEGDISTSIDPTRDIIRSSKTLNQLMEIIQTPPSKDLNIIVHSLKVLQSTLNYYDQKELDDIAVNSLNSIIITTVVNQSKEEKIVIPSFEILYSISVFPINLSRMEQLQVGEILLNVALLYRHNVEVYASMLPLISKLLESPSSFALFQDSNLCELLIPLLVRCLSEEIVLLNILNILKSLLTDHSRNISLYVQLRGEQYLFDILNYWLNKSQFSIVQVSCSLLFMIYHQTLIDGRSVFNNLQGCECMVMLLKLYGEEKEFFNLMCDVLCLLCEHNESALEIFHNLNIFSILFNLQTKTLTIDWKFLCLFGALVPLGRSTPVDSSIIESLLKSDNVMHTMSLIQNCLSSSVTRQNSRQPSIICQLAVVVIYLCSKDSPDSSILVSSDFINILGSVVKAYSSNDKVLAHVFAMTCELQRHASNLSDFFEYCDIVIPSLLQPSVTVCNTLLCKYSMKMIYSLARNPTISEMWAKAGICDVVAQTFRECHLNNDSSALRLCSKATGTLCQCNRSYFESTSIFSTVLASLKNHQGENETIFEILANISDLCGHGSNLHLPSLEKFVNLQIDKVIAVLIEFSSPNGCLGLALAMALESLTCSSQVSLRLGEQGISSLFVEKFEQSITSSDIFSLKFLIICNNFSKVQTNCSRLATSMVMSTIFSIIRLWEEKSICIAELASSLLSKLARYADRTTLEGCCDTENCNLICVLLLKYHLSNQSITVNLCHLIFFLTNKLTENKLQFQNVGVIECLFPIMRVSLDNAEIIEAICRALRSLSFHPLTSQMLAECGFSECALDNLLKYVDSVEIVEHIVCIIANMTSNRGEGASILSIGDSKICDTIFVCADKYQSNSTIAISVSKIFSFLCSISGMTRYLGEIGSCKLLAHMMQKHLENEPTIKSACVACRHLCEDELNAKIFLEEGMSPILMALLRHYTSNIYISDSILRSFQLLIRVTPELHPNNFVKPLSELCVTSINISMNDMNMIIQCCEVLIGLVEVSFGVQSGKDGIVCFRAILEPGTLSVLCTTLDRHSSDISVAEKLLHVLHIILSHSTSYEGFFSYGLPRILSKISRGNVPSQLKSCWFCDIISLLIHKTPEKFVEVELSDIIDSLLTMIDINSKDLTLCIAACEALFRVNDSRLNSGDLLPSRCAGIVCGALKHSYEVERSAEKFCQLISSLTRWSHLLPSFRDENLSSLVVQIATFHSRGTLILWHSIVTTIKHLMNDPLCLSQFMTLDIINVVLNVFEIWWEDESLMELLCCCLTKINSQLGTLLLPNTSYYQVLVRVLRKYPQNEKILVPLCHSLELSIHSPLQQELVIDTGIELPLCRAISQCVETNFNNGEVVTILTLFLKICRDNDVNLRKFGNAGFCTSVLALLVIMEDNPKDLVLPFECLEQLFTITDNRRYFSGVEHSPHLIAAIRSSKRDLFISVGLKALLLLVSENQEFLFQVGCTELIFEIIQIHSLDEKILEIAATVFWKLCENNNQIRLSASQIPGSFTTFADILRIHSGNPNILLAMTYLLYTMLDIDSSKFSNLKTSSLEELLITQATLYPKNRELVYQSLRLLRLISEIQLRFYDSLGYPTKLFLTLASLVVDYHEDVPVLTELCGFLVSFSTKTFSNELDVYSQMKICEEVVKILELSLSRREIQLLQQALLLSRNLCRKGPRLISVMLERGLSGTLVAVIKRICLGPNPPQEVITATMESISSLANFKENNPSGRSEFFCQEGICESTIMILKDHIEDQFIVQSSSKLISHLAKTDSCRRRFFKHGCCELLITVIRQFLQNPDIIKYVCKSFINFSQSHEGILLLIDCNALDALLLTFKTFVTDDIETSTVLCAAMTAMVKQNTSVKSKLVHAGYLDLLLLFLNSHRSVEGVVIRSFNAISSFISENQIGSETLLHLQAWNGILECAMMNISNRLIVISLLEMMNSLAKVEIASIGMNETRVCEITILIFSQFREDSEVIMLGCIAVERLAARNVSYLAELYRSDFAKVLTLSLHPHISNSDVLDSGIKLIYLFVKSSHDFKRQLNMSDVYNILLFPALGSDSLTSEILTYICEVTAILEPDSFSKPLLGKSSAVSLVNALNTYLSDEIILVSICRCVHVLTKNSNENSSKLCHAGLCHALIACFRLHCLSKNLGIQICAVMTAIMESSPEVIISLQIPSTCQSLAKFIQKYVSDFECSVAACRVIKVYARSPSERELFSSLGVCNTVASSFDLFVKDMDSIDFLNIIAAIHSLAFEHAINCEIFGSKGTCENIIIALQRYHSNIRGVSLCLKVIFSLASHELNSKRLGAGGVFQIIEKLFEEYISETHVLRLGYRALSVLTLPIDNKTFFLSTSLYFHSVKIMEKYLEDITLVQLICDTIISLLSNVQSDKAVVVGIVNANLPSVLSFTLSIHPRIPAIVDQICQIFEILANDKNGRTLIDFRDSKVCNGLVDCLKINAREMPLNSRICCAIKAIASWNMNKYHFLELNFSSVLCETFDFALEVEDIVLIGKILDTISVMVSDCCDCQRQFGQTSMISWISDLLGAQNGAIIDEKCLKCVACLCKCGDERSTINEYNCQQFGSEVIGSIMSIIHEQFDNPAILISALHALQNLCSISENVNHVQHYFCCENLTKLMISYSHDVKICEVGCATLSVFVSRENFQSLYRSRVGDVFAQILKRHLSSCRQILKSICTFICDILTCCENFPGDFFPSQLCGLIVEGWRRNLDDSYLMESTCLAIQKLSNLSLANRREFGIVGVIETILRGLKIHERNARILPCAEGALRSLAQGSIENQERLAVSGASEVLQSIVTTSGVWFSAVQEAE